MSSALLLTKKVWRSMLRRCLNPQDTDWEKYGGRGIKVCDQWANSFESFLSDMGVKPNGLTLERKNNDGNYEPDNCCWASYRDQNLNRRKQRNNGSGVIGVSYNKKHERWVVQVSTPTERLILYRGLDFFEAICIRKSYENQRWQTVD